MGKRHKQAFEDEKTHTANKHGKMLNLVNDKRNTNQDYIIR